MPPGGASERQLQGADRCAFINVDAVTSAAGPPDRRAPELDLAPLDGLRALSALLIAAGHLFSTWLYTDGPGGPQAAVHSHPLDLNLPVSLFIVLSGFTLTAVYPDVSPSPRAALAFFVRRLVRLAPLYQFSLLLAVPVTIHYNEGFTYGLFKIMAITALGLQSLIPDTEFTFNGPLWTVSALLVCYALYPFFLRPLRARPGSALLVLLLFLSVATYRLACDHVARNGFGGVYYLHHFVGYRLPGFVCGMCAALLARGHRLPRASLFSEICSVFVIASLASVMVTTRGDFRSYTELTGTLEFALVPLHCVWLWALASPDCRGPTRWALRSRPLRRLGAASYALYCLHMPATFWIAWLLAGGPAGVPPRGLGDFSGWFFFPLWSLPLLLAALAAIALGAHEYVDLPCRRWAASRLAWMR
eukprot:tig00000760_g3926.t1